MERLLGEQVVKLLWHLPIGTIDRRYSPNLADLEASRVVTLELTVDKHHPPPAANRRIPYLIDCSDATGEITLIYFHGRKDYLTSALPEGEQRLVSGTAELYDGRLQMTHPDMVGRLDERDNIMRVQPVYPLTEGLSQNVLGKSIAGALERAPELPEWLDPAFMKERGWESWRDALQTAHAPLAETDLYGRTLARSRLAFDEMLARQGDLRGFEFAADQTTAVVVAQCGSQEQGRQPKRSTKLETRPRLVAVSQQGEEAAGVLGPA